MKILIYCIEFFLALIIGWFGVAAIATTLTGTNGVASNGEIFSIIFVFIFAPILIFIFILRAILMQRGIASVKFGLFMLVLVSSLLLINSWGLHSSKIWSVVSCAASVITAVIGLMQIKNLRKKLIAA